jgi:hypothetical protein
MISKLIASVALLVSSAAALPAGQEKASLQHKYVKGAKDSYRMTAKIDQGGQEATLTIDFQIVIQKVTETGEADFEFKIDKIEGMPEPDESGITGRFDKMGLPQAMESQGAGPILAIFSLAGYLPGGEVEVGKDFNIDWKAISGAATIKGKGTLKSMTSGDNALADIDYTAVLEDGPNTTVNLSIKSKIALTGGRLVSASGTADLTDMKASFKIERLAPSK